MRPGRDGSEPGRSVERSRLAGSVTACRLVVAWLPNDVPAFRGLAVAWLKRGASASELLWNQACRYGSFAIPGKKGCPMAVVMIGAGPHKASHTAVAISAAEEPLGSCGCALGRAGGTAAGVGAGVAGADLGHRGRRRAGPPAGPAAGRGR